MAKEKKNNELSDEDIFYMTEGLTKELIKVKNEQLRDEFLQLKEDMGLKKEDDDTQLYRSYVGHKIAVLLNTVEHLIRDIKQTREMFAEALGEIIDTLNDKT
jgi:predicted hydrocarbon binding protein